MTPNALALDDPGRCPLCGGPNDCPLCSLTPHKGPCWCSSIDLSDALLARVPEDRRNQACICSRCVEIHRRQAVGPG